MRRRFCKVRLRGGECAARGAVGGGDGCGGECAARGAVGGGDGCGGECAARGAVGGGTRINIGIGKASIFMSRMKRASDILAGRAMHLTDLSQLVVHVGRSPGAASLRGFDEELGSDSGCLSELSQVK